MGWVGLGRVGLRRGAVACAADVLDAVSQLID